MQTIARANRNYPGKEAGFIVDYVGVFRNLQKALAIYGGGNTGAGDPPIRDKSDLVEHLRHLVAAMLAYLEERGIGTGPIKRAQGLEKVALLGDAVEKRDYLSRERTVARFYKAILPDPASSEFSPDVVLISVLAERTHTHHPPDVQGSHVSGPHRCWTRCAFPHRGWQRRCHRRGCCYQLREDKREERWGSSGDLLPSSNRPLPLS